MFNLCDIDDVYLKDYIFYTEMFLNSEYVKANGLDKHIHIFNNMVPLVDYHFFMGLKGKIATLTETTSTKEYNDGDTDRISAEIRQFKFKENLELQQLSIDEQGHRKDIFFTESLKQPSRVRVECFTKGEMVEWEDTCYDKHMEREQRDTHTLYNNESGSWKGDPHSKPKYIYQSGKIVRKIVRINNQFEQSKNVTYFNTRGRITECVGYSQSGKDDRLYDLVFQYDAQYNIKKITYTRYKAKKHLNGKDSEFRFKYDSKGRFRKFITGPLTIYLKHDDKDNPISLSVVQYGGRKTVYSYQYDEQGNWVSREMTRYDHIDVWRKKKIFESKTTRIIEYHS